MKYTTEKPYAVFDIETYRNYFLVMFRNVDTGKTVYYEAWPGKELEVDRIKAILRKFRIVSFNGNSYDIPMLTLALTGASTGDLKRASDNIILADLRPWLFYEHYECEPPGYLDHIDLIEVAPGQASLKIYGGRLHSKRMQDLPIDPDAEISPYQREQLRRYCANDLQTTIDLLKELKSQLEIRATMSEEYGIDLRSKSDAQIAEAVLKHELEKITRRRVQRPEIRPGTFMYRPPKFLEYETPQMREMFNRVRRAGFVVRRDGKVDMPKELRDATVQIGQSVYRLGIGGLHSSEESVSHYTDDEYEIIDADVASYYPSMIIENKFVPRSFGENMLKVYADIYHRRLDAKSAGNKTVAETLKIVLNGTFGKLGSPYSILYSPDLMIQVTVTGQLSLLMLIERLELAGISVISANTDGLVSRVPRHLRDRYELILGGWELDTGMVLETKLYHSIHSRDVNNYIALPYKWDKERKVWTKEIDTPKLKGAYAESGPGIPGAFGLKKNPNTEICTEAVVAYLKDGVPIEDTIERCNDVRKFLTIQRVSGGAVFVPKNADQLRYCGLTDEEIEEIVNLGAEVEIGKAIRWYYSTNGADRFAYKTNGNTVSRTEGAVPLMELPDELPDDIDYDWYVREAYGILKDIGVTFKDPTYAGRRGDVLGRLPDKKTIHVVGLPDAVSLCGVRTPGPRVRWIEYGSLPEGQRLCAKCRRESEL